MSYHPAGRSGDDDDDDFEEHDPTPYGGGYDISLTYGCPLPPSEDICYPASSSDDDSDNDPPQISSNSEPPSYADEDLDDKYEGYRRPKPRPSLAYDTTPGAGGHGSAPPPTDSGVNRPGYGGESNYGGTGHVWRPDRDSGYDRPGLDYGSNYGQQGGSEHGSEYGRNPQHEGPSAEHGFGYRSGDGRKSEGDKPSLEHGFGNGFGYQGRTKLDGGKPSYGEEDEEYGRGSEKPSDGGPSYESREGEGSVKPSGDMGESRYGDEGYGQVKYDMGRLQIIKNSDIQELGELGSGAFGSVFHGKWRGTEVAIKRINNKCFAGKPSKQKSMRDDFLKEATTLAELHHPKVVAFYGVVLDGPGDSVATLTEYMVHGSLRTALHQNEGGLDERKRLLIARDVACGMEYLHSKKIVHFDLKSDNLLVDLSNPDNPKCKVADLGLSKVKRETLISGGMRGTLPWMAPELLNGRSKLVSEKVDVFSFGIVIWELLTGEEPYHGLDGWRIIGGIVSNTLRPPVPDNCDPDWRSLMERCWSAEPSDRPSFTEIVDKLQAMLS